MHLFQQNFDSHPGCALWRNQEKSATGHECMNTNDIWTTTSGLFPELTHSALLIKGNTVVCINYAVAHMYLQSSLTLRVSSECKEPDVLHLP